MEFNLFFNGHISITWSFYVRRIHRPISLSVGLLVTAIGCTIFFVPQFVAPPYRPQDEASAEGLCYRNGSSSFCDDHDRESLSHYLPLFVIARVLTGVGGAPIYSAGINYMDDCSTREKFAVYSGMHLVSFIFWKFDYFQSASGVYFTGSVAETNGWSFAEIAWSAVALVERNYVVDSSTPYRTRLFLHY